MSVDAVANTTVVAQTTPTSKATPSANRTPSGVADACSSGVEQLPPVPVSVGTQLAAHYSAVLGAIAKDPSYSTEALANAARNAVISAFGINPADPNFDVKNFHPANSDLAAITKGLYMTHRLNGDADEVGDKNLNLAFALDRAHSELVVRYFEGLKNSYDKISDPSERQAFLEKPSTARALRTAAEWVNTPRLRTPAWGWAEAAKLRMDALTEDLSPGLNEAFLAECASVSKRR
jgi:hypothetical protein